MAAGGFRTEVEDEKDGGATLNGAQIASLMNVIKMVKEGNVSRNEAISIITSTLGISRENAEGRGKASNEEYRHGRTEILEIF